MTLSVTNSKNSFNIDSNSGISENMQNRSTGGYVDDDEDEDYETDEDDSYEELDISAWGDNKKEQVGWHTLVDHSVKVKPGGVGSGDLHRRGGNFKPVSEQFILNQRLKNGIPSASGTKKKKKSKNASTVTKTKTTTTTKSVIFAGSRNKPYIPMKFTAVTQRVPIKDPTATAWGQLPLSSTPFWKEKDMNKEEEHDQSLYQAQAQAQPSSTQAQPLPQQQAQLQQTAINSIWNPNIPSFIPSNNSLTKGANYNIEAPEFVPLYQIPVKKNIKITPPSTPTPSGTTSTTTTTKSRLHVDTSLLRRHLTKKTFHPSTTPTSTTQPKLESQTGPESTRGLEEPVPLLQFNLELAPGVSAIIQAFIDSDPVELVEQFAQKHQLNVTNTAKEKIANTIKLLMDKKKEA